MIPWRARRRPHPVRLRTLAADEKARRVRSLLSSYYGATETSSMPEPVAEQPGTPLRSSAPCASGAACHRRAGLCHV